MGDLCQDPLGDCARACWLGDRRPGGYAFAASRPFGGSVQPQAHHPLVAGLQRVMSLALALVSWKHLSIPQIAPLREGNRALAAVAAIFERHHPIFHFDDPSVPLIYLLLFIGASGAHSVGRRAARFLRPWFRVMHSRTPSPGTIAFFKSDLSLVRL